MKHVANERGAALILVLFGITLAMLFIMFQFGQLIQANQQVASAGHTIDAQNMRDMAVRRYQAEVRHLLGSDIQFGVDIVDGEEIETDIVDVVGTLRPITKEPLAFELDEAHAYQIKNQVYDETKQILTYEVEATAYGKTATQTSDITIIQRD